MVQEETVSGWSGTEESFRRLDIVLAGCVQCFCLGRDVYGLGSRVPWRDMLYLQTEAKTQERPGSASQNPGLSKHMQLRGQKKQLCGGEGVALQVMCMLSKHEGMSSDTQKSWEKSGMVVHTGRWRQEEHHGQLFWLVRELQVQ